MKRPHLFLCATLALNLALGLALWRKLAVDFPDIPVAPAPAPTSATDLLLAALASGDAAALRAAGLPDDVARHLALGHALAKLQARLRAVQPAPPADPRYWRHAAYLRNPYTRAQRTELAAAQREFADSLRAALGEDVSIDPIRDPRRAFLPATKQEQLARIERDYAELMDDVSREAGALRLPSDLEKLRFLRDEKARDIAALLTPAEREMLDFRESYTALTMRINFGEGIATEDDFRKLYALQSAFDEKYPDVFSPNRDPSIVDAGRLRFEAEPRLDAAIHAALGDAKYDALLSAADQDHRALTSLERRLDLPPGTTDRALAVRDTYAAESARIYHDPALAEADRQTQIEQLATRARQDLTATLGPDAAAAYAPAATWLRYLAQGWAFTANPKDAAGQINLFFAASHPLPPRQPSVASPIPTVAPKP